MYCGSCLQIITRFGYPFLILIPNCDHVMPVVATTATASPYNPNKEAPLHDAYSQCVMETNAGDEEVLMLAQVKQTRLCTSPIVRSSNYPRAHRADVYA